MKTQQAIHKIKSSPYFVALDKLLKMDTDTFYSKRLNANTYLFKWRDLEDDYTGSSVFHTRQANLTKHIPEFKKKGIIQFGLYSFRYYLNISVSNSCRKEAKVTRRVYIYPEGIRPNFTYEQEQELETLILNDSDNIDNIEDVVFKHIAKFIYSTEFPLFHLLQYKCNGDKERARMTYKNSVKGGLMETPIRDTTVLNWIHRKFNIIAPTVELGIRAVNMLGKRLKETEVYSFDYSFMDSFDGDIDEIEGAMYDNNPVKEDVIYI